MNALTPRLFTLPSLHPCANEDKLPPLSYLSAYVHNFWLPLHVFLHCSPLCSLTHPRSAVCEGKVQFWLQQRMSGMTKIFTERGHWSKQMQNSFSCLHNSKDHFHTHESQQLLSPTSSCHGFMAWVSSLQSKESPGFWSQKNLGTVGSC